MQIGKQTDLILLDFSKAFDKVAHEKILQNYAITSADPEGGQGVRTPPGKSQVIWVSIGNKQLDPPPGKSCTLPGKCWTPSGTLKNGRFL